MHSTLIRLFLFLTISFNSTAFCDSIRDKVYYLYGGPALGNPMLEVEINGVRQCLFLDTGTANSGLSLKAHFLLTNAKEASSRARSKNLDGLVILSPLWEVSKVKVSDIKIEKIFSEKFKDASVKIGKTPPEKTKNDGVIGLGAFKNKKVVLDFENNKIFSGDNLSLKNIKKRCFFLIKISGSKLI